MKTKSNKIHKLIIIGSGPAGLTAAIYAARANCQPLVIDGAKPGGQLMGTSLVENWPGIESIMGPQLMMNMRTHAQKFGTEFIEGDVAKVDFSASLLRIWVEEKQFAAHAVIIATGASPKKLKCPGEDEYWGKGVTTCAVCDGAFYKNKKVVIVGGGDSAMENASFLRKFTEHITIVHILDQFTATFAMQQRIVNDPKITTYFASTVSAIHGDGKRVTGVTITNQETKKEIVIDADGVFISIGLSPNTKPFIGHVAVDKMGYIVVKNQTHTAVKGVFVAGDAQDYRYRQAITSAGSGCMAAMDAERYLHEIVGE